MIRNEIDRSRRDLLVGTLAWVVPGLLAALATQSRAHSREQSPTQRAAQPLRLPATLIELIARDIHAGRDVRLLRDVIGQRVAALSFFFTGCSTVCPLQSMSLAGAQALLDGVLGPKAVFVSISIDWWGDTPNEIEEFARRHGAGPNWRFLKAPIAEVDQLRRGLDSFDPTRENHPPVIAIGKVGAPRWSRFAGAPEPAAIAAEVRAWASQQD